MPNTIQPRDRAGFNGWWHGRHFVRNVQNRDGHLDVPYLYENGDKVILNWNWLDNNWNGNNPALRAAGVKFIIPVPEVRVV